MTNKLMALILISMLAACSFEREAGDAWIVAIPAVQSDQFKPALVGAPALKVLLPDAPELLDTRRVALHRADGALDYYADMRWGDFLPLMLQSIVTRDLGASGAVGTVVPDISPLPAHNQLQLHVTDFSIRHDPNRIAAVIELTYQVSNNGSIRTTGSLRGEQPLLNETQLGIRGSFAGAYHQVLLQLAHALAEAQRAGQLQANQHLAKAPHAKPSPATSRNQSALSAP